MPKTMATDRPRTPMRQDKLEEVQHISQANFPPKPPSVKPLPLLRPLVGALCTDCRSHYAANRSALACPAAAASADHSRRLDLAEADCTERYFTMLRCGDKRLLFSRIEHFPPSTPANSEPEPVWQYVVRQGPGRDDYPMGHVPWSTLQIAINRSLGLAANAALLCAQDERTLVAYGGEGRDGDASSGARRTTAYLRVEDHYMWSLKAQPLAWARPELAVPAKPQDTGCIDERGRSFCEFDGKNSVTRYDGHTLLFARSNLKGQGGRHVQLAASADGLSRWSRFRQLRIAGVASGSSATNIYYFNVRKVRAGPCRLLLATFPAVLQPGDRGGVYASVSVDGESWETPARLLTSRVLPNWRTSDHPVDTKDNVGVGETAVKVTIAHNVAVPTEPERDDGPPIRSQDICRGKGDAALPVLCEYSYAWKWKMVEPKVVQVQLGSFAPWRLTCARARATRGSGGAS